MKIDGMIYNADAIREMEAQAECAAAEIDRLSAALDAMTRERDAARTAVTFVRNVAQSAMTAEHDQDERESLLDLDTLRFQRDCDITTARDIRAMIEQENKGWEKS